MMELFFVLKWIHVLSAAVLFGTGLGIAFFMLAAHRSGDAHLVAGTAQTVVVADFLFTATAVVVQPITGIGLAHVAGYSLFEGWLVLTYLLYVLIGACWLPVVWMQARMRRIAMTADTHGAPLPPEYHRLFRYWFALGWPAFAAVVVIYALMIWRPSISF